MITKQVSVVIPTRGDRLEQLRGCLKSITATSPRIEEEYFTSSPVDIIVVTDGECPEVDLLAGEYATVLTLPDAPGAVECWNRGAAIAGGEILMLGADDLIFHEGWYEAGMAAMARLNWNGLVAVNDLSPNAGTLATHYLMSKSYAVNELRGCLAIPAYEHCWIDTEVTHRAQRDKCFIYAEDCVVEHNHYLWGKAAEDETYIKGRESYQSGRELYEERAELGFPNTWDPYFSRVNQEPPIGWGSVAVGTRIHKSADGDFFNSWTMMLVTGLDGGDSVLSAPIGKPSHIAASQLARGLLSSKCDSILFVDDDMEFSPDALRTLRNNSDNWDYDVVMAFCTHKTIPPHAVVLRKLEQPGLPLSLKGEHYGSLREIPDNEVIDVDAVGLAFTLVKRHVLESMVNEFGALHTSFFEWGKFEEGEDITFSRWCREHGYKLGVDTSVKIGHLGKYAFGWKSFHDYLEQEQRIKV